MRKVEFVIDKFVEGDELKYSVHVKVNGEIDTYYSEQGIVGVSYLLEVLDELYYSVKEDLKVEVSEISMKNFIE